jgi:hypothetical protein
MKVQVTEAHVLVQRMVSVVKMVTMLEEYIIEERCSVVSSLVIERTQCKGYS